MKKLQKYKRSSVNKISLVINDEKISFNLFEELRINEILIDREIKEQPSYYGMLILANGQLRTRFYEAKEERKSIYYKLFLKAKNRNNNGRPYSDEMAKAWVETRKEYISITKRCIMLKDQSDKIYGAMKAFEQRASMLQTLSSNTRKQKI